MGWFVLLGIASLLVMYFAQRIGRDQSRSDDGAYIRNEALFSTAERSFLEVLEQAIGDSYRVFGKVHVAHVVSVTPQARHGELRQAYDLLNAEHFDFVLCDTRDMSIAAVVELEDPSHKEHGRQARDEFLAGLCRSIALPLVRVVAQRAYSIPEMRARILSAIKVEAVDGGNASFAEGRHGPRCPQCEAPMVLRQATNGETVGRPF